MATPSAPHNYGPECRLAPLPHPELLGSDVPPGSGRIGVRRSNQGEVEDSPPPTIRAQFFYASQIPIDDPLSPAVLAAVSTSTSGATSDGVATAALLRPFSERDNLALERAWRSLASPRCRRTHARLLEETSALDGSRRAWRRSNVEVDGEAEPQHDDNGVEALTRLVDTITARHLERHGPDARLARAAAAAAASSTPTRQKTAPAVRTTVTTPGWEDNLLEDPLALLQADDSVRAHPPPVPCCAELPVDASSALRSAFCGLVRRRGGGGRSINSNVLTAVDQNAIVRAVMVRLRRAAKSKVQPPGPDAGSSASASGRPRAMTRITGDINPKAVDDESASDGPGTGARGGSGGGSSNSGAAAGVPLAMPIPQIGRRSSLKLRTVGGSSDASRPATPKSAAGSAAGSFGVKVAPALDDGISGKPFVRVGVASKNAPEIGGSNIEGVAAAAAGVSKPAEDDASVKEALPTPPPTQQKQQQQEQEEPPTPVATDEPSVPGSEQQPVVDEAAAAAAPVQDDNGTAEIPVGISRLHMVSLPLLQMKPIYWSPLNDVAIVTRATWFYRDTMVPVEPAVANQLEAGFRELRAWTETWADELRCAVAVGPLGEEKVSHRLWPRDPAPDRLQKSAAAEGGLASLEPPISADPFCAARCFCGEAAAEGSLEPVVAGADEEAALRQHRRPRRYPNYHVIYKNATEAFLLKPSLKPSAYYGRRPVSKIAKGIVVGIPVVRGFDRATWDRVHEKKKNKASATADAALLSLDAAAAAPFSPENPGDGPCEGCEADDRRGRVTDLVLVAHGIGQKFAERVESFHFTHAINGFRRAINMELNTDAVKSVLRDGQNGIMVLPVNWRHTLSLDDGGPPADDEEADASGGGSGFTLKDIEPQTIPHVRGLISDIMFDIPFYMSHHRPRMIRGLVAEANRVYRLWCRNNPGFAESGRVHLIGHSLGSAMAMEVLSKQPTHVPKLNLDVPHEPGTPVSLRSQQQPPIETRHFEFDTTNLFLLGSPAGFFLLLERGKLLPRRGRLKPGADKNDSVAPNVVGECGTFGCLAVDNIYNILAREDPIAYLLNGAIDPLFARSLRPAYVPSATQTWFEYMTQSIRGLLPGGGAAAASGVASQTTAAAAVEDGEAGTAMANSKPAPTHRLPSQLELDVHDFTREELAERKAFLLNDNGQLDYFLRSGGGPLEIQYLNMLSAHTSYWYNQDLVRLLCMEIGRRPGRNHTLPAMRPVKVGRRGHLLT